MKNLVIIFFCAGIISCGKTQNQESKKVGKVIIFPYGKESFDWKTIEIKVADKLKEEYGKSMPWLVIQHADSYISNIHVIDFNNDGVNDFVYSGYGPVTLMTTINLGGNDNGYFSYDGKIIDVTIENKLVTKIFISSIVSTGGPAVYGQSVVDVSYQNRKATFTTVFKSETIQGTPIPKLISDFEIETVSDTLLVRDSPSENNAPYSVYDLGGNRLGKIAKGTKARVIGEQTDSFGRLWLCALVYPKYKIFKYPYMNNIYDPTDETSRMVWVLDKGIKRIE